MSFELTNKSKGKKKLLFFWDQLKDKKVTNEVMVYFPFHMNNSTKNMSQYCVNFKESNLSGLFKIESNFNGSINVHGHGIQ